MHHKILNGQEYKEKNAALYHYFVVVQQCIQNKILPNKKCIMSQIYLTCLQGYQGGGAGQPGPVLGTTCCVLTPLPPPPSSRDLEYL